MIENSDLLARQLKEAAFDVRAIDNKFDNQRIVDLLQETYLRVDSSLINYFNKDEVVRILESILNLSPLDELVKESPDR